MNGYEGFGRVIEVVWEKVGGGCDDRKRKIHFHQWPPQKMGNMWRRGCHSGTIMTSV